jgi:hypothetical protein
MADGAMVALHNPTYLCRRIALVSQHDNALAPYFDQSSVFAFA